MPSQTPIEVFEENLEDAHQLIELSRVLTNYRQRRLRPELRDRIGGALRFPKRSWDQLDGMESELAWVVFKPSGGLTRERFTEPALRPLLRQAVVAIAAAVETYVLERADDMVGPALSSPDVPKKLREISMTMGSVIDIERTYQRRGWGHRKLIYEHLKTKASAAPTPMHEVFSIVGVEKLWERLDFQRNVPKGCSVDQLERLAKRRNDIAHSADRHGSRRRKLSISDAETFYDNARSIVEALEVVTKDPRAKRSAPVRPRTKVRRRPVGTH